MKRFLLSTKQESLAAIRLNNSHYKGDLIAIDTHRIMSSSQRIMPKKKKQPKELDLQSNYQGLPAKLVAEGINPKIL